MVCALQSSSCICGTCLMYTIYSCSRTMCVFTMAVQIWESPNEYIIYVLPFCLHTLNPYLSHGFIQRVGYPGIFNQNAQVPPPPSRFANSAIYVLRISSLPLGPQVTHLIFSTILHDNSTIGVHVDLCVSLLQKGKKSQQSWRLRRPSSGRGWSLMIGREKVHAFIYTGS